MQMLSDKLELNHASSLKNHDIAIIADCDHADIFAVSHIAMSSGTVTLSHGISTLNRSAQLSKLYLQGAQVGQFVWRMFYLRRIQGKPIRYGLFLKDQSGRSEELLDGVENMQLYFAKQDNLQHYIPTTQVSTWQRIAKVKIILTFAVAHNKTRQQILIIGTRN